ncbi:hypothetical protein BDW66DRAFT_106410 [Aspergillus desertorum]
MRGDKNGVWSLMEYSLLSACAGLTEMLIILLLLGYRISRGGQTSPLEDALSVKTSQQYTNVTCESLRGRLSSSESDSTLYSAGNNRGTFRQPSPDGAHVR